MKVEFYVDARGHKPVAEYLKALPAKERAKLAVAFWRVENYGLKGSGVSLRQIDGKLWEVRVSAHRAFYVIFGEAEMLVLHAYKKEGPKAPTHDIEVARSRMQEALGE